jgi:hypothetical protein
MFVFLSLPIDILGSGFGFAVGVKRSCLLTRDWDGSFVPHLRALPVPDSIDRTSVASRGGKRLRYSSIFLKNVSTSTSVTYADSRKISSEIEIFPTGKGHSA